MRSKIGLLLCGGIIIFSACKSIAEDGMTASVDTAHTNQTYDLDPVFFLLGSADEYMGRNLEKNYLEHFYASEEKAAKLYAVYLEKALSDRSITTGYSVVISDEGGHISFRSEEMNQIINSYYEEIEVDIFDDVIGKLKGDIFERNGDLKLAYLAGAYSRYGEGNEFNLANAADKVDRIIMLLMKSDCDKIKLVRKYTFPMTSIITFVPSEEISNLFSYITWQKENANQHVDLTPDGAGYH